MMRARVAGGGFVRQRVRCEEAVRDDLAIGHRRRHLAERAYHEHRDMIAAGGPIVEKNSMQLRRRGHLDVAFLEQLARGCFESGSRRPPPRRPAGASR